MKTAKEILEESLSYMNCEGIIGENTRLERVVLYAMEEYRSQLWTSPCACPNDEKTGETLCCNLCGKPTARTESNELPGDEESGVIAVNIASNVKPRLTENEEAFFIAGFQECIKYLRTSPLLASRDARIRELEEWISVEVRLPEKEKNVLVLRSNPNVVVCGYIHERGHWIWSNMRGDTHKEGDLHKITHWKNLPTPPKN